MLKNLNQAVRFIDKSLTEEINWEEWFSINGIDGYHFKTVFYHLTGLTLSQYVKKQRLVAANTDLLKNSSVTEVSYKYCYQSIDGFTRAFKNEFGYLPSEVFTNQRQQHFNKLQFNIEVQGGESMEYRITEMPKFNLVGVSAIVPMQFEGVNEEIVKLAYSITKEQRDLMHQLQNIIPMEVVSASYNADYMFQEEKGNLTHMIAVLTTADTIDNQLEVVTVEACDWAVFPNQGVFPETLQKTMADIYSKWLVNSDYILLPYPTFSFSKMSDDKKTAKSEIWIPVKTKDQ